MATDSHYREPAMEYLRGLGYNPEWVNNPVDIRATMNDTEYWIELKGTGDEDEAFGAATVTEWMCANENRENFYFLIANKPGIESVGYNDSKSTTEWSFELVPPEVMMAYSRISPPQLKFTFPLNNPDRRPPKRRTAIEATWENIVALNDFIQSLRPGSSEEE